MNELHCLGMVILRQVGREAPNFQHMCTEPPPAENCPARHEEINPSVTK